MTNIVDDSSIGNLVMFVSNFEAVLSLEMTLASLTNWVEPILTEVLVDGLHVANVFGLAASKIGRQV